jgi:hypothetical protein
MADVKITALTVLTAADPINDAIPIVDVSDNSMAASGTTKRISVNNILGASGTATLASATITGDLTVDTSTLKVDSANNRVGIGTASPQQTLDVSGTINSTQARFGNVNGRGLTIGTALVSGVNEAGSVFNALGSGSGAHIFQVDSVDQMRLNSTGLGVGVASPSYRIHSVVTSGYAGAFKSSTGVAGGILCGNTVGDLIVGVDASGNGRVTADTSKYLGLGSNGINDRVILDTSGNVGVGGSPAASKVEVYSSNTGTSGLAEANALKVENNNATVGNAAGLFLSQSGNAGCGVAAIATSRTGGSRASALSLYYYNQATSASPIEGARIDTSGNLLIGTTSSSETSSVGHKINSSATAPWLATVGSASTNANVTSSVYSTGAAAYRFYVGYGGTVFATNTTISAISDARLKENVQDIDVGLAAILSLKPRKFDWKSGKGKDIKGDRGFIAQEFEQVFPQLVDDWADPAPEGEAPYKSVRQDLIPVLVKAIQELTARVQTIEAK